jgi:hypothetical protein
VLLTSIPKELVNLDELLCDGCPLMTSIPDQIRNIDLRGKGCHWLPHNDPVPSSRIARVTVIQKWVRRSRKGRLLSQWMKTKNFNEWFYAGNGIGGKVHKKGMEHFLRKAYSSNE